MLLLRDARESDIPRLMEILEASPEAGRWSETDLRPKPGRHVTVAELDGQTAGFLLAACPIAEEAEILTLAVDPAHRRRGLGRALVETFLHTRQGDVFLEVRPSNLAAQKLYEASGFAPTGTRPRYYRSPDEDALILRCGGPGPRPPAPDPQPASPKSCASSADVLPSAVAEE